MGKIKLVVGSIFFLAGIMLFGMMHIAIAIYIPSLTGWGDPLGLMATALSGMRGWVPYLLSIAFIVVGFVLILMFVSEKRNSLDE